jgi:hypothetical protein
MTADNHGGNPADRGSYVRWHLYYARGRRKLRLGLWRNRQDRVSPEYRFIEVGWYV